MRIDASPPSEIVLEISVFTDPLCCWSWAFEPQLRKLRYAYAGRIAWRTVMGVMIEDWGRFTDPLNAVHRPGQMAPLWLQAGAVSGMPIQADLWIDDPPDSSLPACRAVKAAQMQSPAAAERMLRGLREAAMLDGLNIARPEVIEAVALRLPAEARFDFDRFAADLASPASLTALEEDVKETRLQGVGRYPTLFLRAPGAPQRVVTGWRPYDEFEAAVRELVPELGPPRPIVDAQAYAAYWRGALEREIEEGIGAPAARGCPPPAAAAAADATGPGGP